MYQSSSLVFAFIILTGMQGLSWEFVPYPVKYGVVAVVASMCAIWIMQMAKDQSPDLKIPSVTVKAGIRRIALSLAFASGLTWLAERKFGMSPDNCLIIAAAVGLTIEFTAPWIQKVAFVYLKKLFK